MGRNQYYMNTWIVVAWPSGNILIMFDIFINSWLVHKTKAIMWFLICYVHLNSVNSVKIAMAKWLGINSDSAAHCEL